MRAGAALAAGAFAIYVVAPLERLCIQFIAAILTDNPVPGLNLKECLVVELSQEDKPFLIEQNSYLSNIAGAIRSTRK